MICLTFDIEERFHSHLTPSESKRAWSASSRISAIIDWLIENEKQATFFVVSELAEKYPKLIRKMSENNFEIASHSHTHLRISEDNKTKTIEEITKSKSILENLSGRSVLGFRAPSWSANLTHHWLWEHLDKLGFKYDSSLFPFKTYLYGDNKYNVEPFMLTENLLEIPPSVYEIGNFRIPYGGGFYFRAFPLWFTNLLISSNTKKKRSSLLYFHPWEFDISKEVMEKKISEKIIGNYNVKNNWKRTTKFLKNVDSVTMSQYSQSLRNIPK